MLFQIVFITWWICELSSTYCILILLVIQQVVHDMQKLSERSFHWTVSFVVMKWFDSFSLQYRNICGIVTSKFKIPLKSDGTVCPYNLGLTPVPIEVHLSQSALPLTEAGLIVFAMTCCLFSKASILQMSPSGQNLTLAQGTMLFFSLPLKLHFYFLFVYV